MKNFNIGNRLREIRLRNGLSQEQTANTADITAAYLGQVERGEKNITVLVLEKICNVFNISLHDFFAPEKNNDKQTDIDEISVQILNQLKNKSAAEKKKILRVIKIILS